MLSKKRVKKSKRPAAVGFASSLFSELRCPSATDGRNCHRARLLPMFVAWHSLVASALLFFTPTFVLCSMSGRVLCARRGSWIHLLLGQDLRKPAPGGRRTEVRKSGTTEWAFAGDLPGSLPQPILSKVHRTTSCCAQY